MQQALWAPHGHSTLLPLGLRRSCVDLVEARDEEQIVIVGLVDSKTPVGVLETRRKVAACELVGGMLALPWTGLGLPKRSRYEQKLRQFSMKCPEAGLISARHNIFASENRL